MDLSTCANAWVDSYLEALVRLGGTGLQGLAFKAGPLSCRKHSLTLGAAVYFTLYADQQWKVTGGQRIVCTEARCACSS